MDDECLSLTWNSHGATYQEMLNHLRIENILTDCTLACDGQKFSVHKLVLVTCSDFFKSLLGDVACQHPIIYLRGVNGIEMQTLIDFMYLGKVDVPNKAVPNLISTAEVLQIKGLGVFNVNTDKAAAEKSTCKRKRSNVSKQTKFIDSSSYHDKVSSHKRSAYDTNSHDKGITDSRKDMLLDNVKEQEFLTNFEDDIYLAQGKDKIDSLSKSIGSENILSSIFKSTPSSLASAFASSESVSSSKNATKESVTLTELTTLQPPQKHSKTINEYYEIGNRSSGMRMNTASFEEESEHPVEALDHSSDVKEEALDYTRSATIEVPETSSLHLNCQNGSASVNRYSAENTNQDHLSRNSTFQQLPFSQDENLNVENATDLSRPFLCPICYKAFAKAAILKRHHLAHFRPYNCHLCPRSFTRREVLAEHVLEHNGADLRLPCPVCNMTIKRKRNLQAHIKVKHPEYHQLKSANNEALF